MYFQDTFNYNIFKNLEITGKFGSPVIRATTAVPQNIISFNFAKTCKNPQNYYVHFYIDDYQFERVWNKPHIYTQLLKKFAGVIGPDFSPYTNLSISQRIFNIYRNKVLSAYWQKQGINVIPNARWIDNCGIDGLNNGLDGLPTHSTIAITTHICLNPISYELFRIIFDEVINKLQPTNLVCIGKLPDEMQQKLKSKNINCYIFNSHIENLEKRSKRND